MPDSHTPPERRSSDSSSIARVFDVLDLVTEQQPTITAEFVMAELGYTKSTAYRYLKTLCDTGLLAPAGGSTYALGSRIAELDRLAHLTDPMLRAGQQVMPMVAAAWPNSIVLLTTLYRDKALCIHVEGPDTIATREGPIPIRRARGLPLPLFHGAASLAMLAYLPPHRVRALYLARPKDIAAAGLGDDFKAFRASLNTMRRDRRFATVGQFNPALAAVAAPILAGDPQEVRGSLTRIIASADMPAGGIETLIPSLEEGAAEIVSRL